MKCEPVTRRKSEEVAWEEECDDLRITVVLLLSLAQTLTMAQQDTKCWLLALVLGLVAVTGFTGVTLWFTLKASDEVAHTRQVGEHDWGSPQEQALVEEVAATASSQTSTTHSPTVALSVAEVVSSDSWAAISETTPQQEPPNTEYQEILSTFSTDNTNTYVHSEHQQSLPTLAPGKETASLQQEYRKKLTEVESNSDEELKAPDHRHRVEKAHPDRVDALLHQEQQRKEPILLQDSANVVLDPEHQDRLPVLAPDSVNTLRHPGPQDRMPVPAPDNEMLQEFFSVSDGLNVHNRNELDEPEGGEEHFFSQYFEYPHDRDHHLPSHWDVKQSDDEGYFNRGPEKYDGEEPDFAENPLAAFLQQKLQDLYSWISSDEDLVEGGSGTGRELLEVVEALNRSLAEGNSSLLVDKLRQMYQGSNVLHNNSLVSFGLLAFDLMLLRNVQQIAWDEDNVTATEMMRDPEVLAMNSLFLPPEQVRQLQDPGAGQQDLEREDRGILYEIMELINGSLRAVLNLGRAYRDGSNVLDCVWTLYCRNLDKTAGLPGPYGFLARINSVGLRLAMGDFPAESALELFAGEKARDSPHMDCDNLFPRCKTQDAVEIVMRSALG